MDERAPATDWPRWVVAPVDDSVFGELLAGLVQICRATSAALVIGDKGTTTIVAASGPGPHRMVPGSTLTSFGVPAGSGVSLELITPDPIPVDDRSCLQAIAALTGRLLLERRSARLASDGTWGLVVVRNDGHIRLVSPMVCRTMAYEPDQVLGRNIFELVHPDDHVLAIDSLARTAAVPGEKYPLDVRFVGADERTLVWEVTAEDRFDVSLDDIVFTVRPADERPEADALVGEQVRVLDMIGRGERAPATLAEIARVAGRRLGVACAVLTVEPDDRERATRVLRLAAADGISSELGESIDGTRVAVDSNTCGASVHQRSALGSGDLIADSSWAGHQQALAAAGFGSCWADPIDSVRITDPLGVLAFFGPRGWTPSAPEVRAADLFASLASVTLQRAHAEAALHHQATHDPLTGLPNRALFLDRLEHALASGDSADTKVAVMFLDLDRFKVVNDALGHEAGDELLVAVAGRIGTVAGAGMTVARFGGDEFTVLVESVRSAADSVAIAEQIIDAFRTPIRVAGEQLMMTVSIGIVLSGAGRMRASTMLRDADAAMYRAKHHGRNRVELFDDRMRARAVARLDLEHALPGSVERGDFSLHYQAEIELDRLSVVGTEALLRWNHPFRGSVAPVDFIPVAEETGVIVELGEWVLAEACRQIARWDAAGPMVAAAPRMWVNISAVQLRQAGFPERVQRLLKAMGTDPDRLGLEITESAVMTDVESAIESLTQLRELGMQTAIDDFGTGYASIAALRRLPIDLVKIDRTLVQDVTADRQGAAVFGAIVDLVHATGSTVVAEGVETEEQLMIVRAVGCDAAQGYWIGRPALPGSTVPDFVWAG